MSTKPIIFISYSHKDEPRNPRPDEEKWLSYIQSFLQPAMKNGLFDLWIDEGIPGGAEWEKHIKDKLARCDICILLVSRHSLNSQYCIDIEVETICQRQEKGESVKIYPIYLTHAPEAALKPVKHLNLRPKDGPLSGFSTTSNRDAAMAAIVDEITKLLGATIDVQAPPDSEPTQLPPFVHVAGLPETAHERLVGRDEELRRLDEAWANPKINVLSLIAEGGTGKSALVNEWLKKLQADHYCGAEMVLGWSFYSQGSKERATSADQFLDWALQRLGIRIDTTSASAKGDAVAEAIGNRRVLLVLDGVEPLQHGPGGQQGELKDTGPRGLLRRLAAMPPTTTHGLVVLTSRLAVKDIGRWKDSAAPILDVERLSDEAGRRSCATTACGESTAN